MIRKILKALFSSASAKRSVQGRIDRPPASNEERFVIEICEGFKSLAGAYFTLKQQGKPRPARGTNQLLEAIIDEIYSPTTRLKTIEMAESWAYETCIPIVTESERRKKQHQEQQIALKAKQTLDAPEKTYDQYDAQTASLMRAIDEKRKSDPLIGAKLGAKEVFQRIVNGMKKSDPKGVHYESLLCILGSLAGY